jgi:hypothetical protein
MRPLLRLVAMGRRASWKHRRPIRHIRLPGDERRQPKLIVLRSCASGARVS